jgi:Xaa-Pro aminopeptidase
MRHLAETEKLELMAKSQRAIKSSGYDALLVTGSGNITYLSAGVVLPFVDQSPDHLVGLVKSGDSEPDVIICTSDLYELVRDQGNRLQAEVYTPNADAPLKAFLNSVIHVLRRKKLTRVGSDYSNVSHSLLEQLREADPRILWGNCDSLLGELRIVKTEAEIQMLENAVRIADRAYVSALNHTESSVRDTLSYTLWEFAERVRVHVGEFGGSGTGNLTILQGEDTGIVHGYPGEHEKFRSGTLSRCEWTNHHFGYWANSARTFVVDRPNPDQLQAYAGNLALKQAAVAALRPGQSSADVFHTVKRFAQQRNIPFWKCAGVGHGIGADEREAPFFVPGDASELRNGMVVVIGVYTNGPAGELICSRDSFEITTDGSRLLSWYKNHDHLYRMVGCSARHG